MNLIELSNQLKDVPDQFLLKEVQAPTGAYPAYMVISELTRRKRMRESAAKEMPETTVAQDLVGEEERARAMAQVQAAQAQPQAQPMIPPQGRLNAPAGLGALPQAQESLAAQDAMGTTPPEMMMAPKGMAGGGMVSFKDGGKVIRAYDGLPSSMFEDLELGPAYTSIEELNAQTEQERREEERKRAEERYKRSQQQFADVMSGKTVLNKDLAESRIGKKGADALRQAEIASSIAKAEQAKTASDVSAPAAALVSPLQARLNAIANNQYALPTADQLAATRTAEEQRYASSVPYRFGFLEDQLKSEAEKLRGREQSNINEALIQAGLGIMGSKSPRFLGAVSEGGLAALGAYRQGQKDIREGERALLQSRIKAAEAQSLYDKDKMAAGNAARAEAISLAKTGAELQSTESANLLRALQGQTALARESREAAESPSKIAYYTGLARQAEAAANLKEAPTTPEVNIAKVMISGDLKKTLGREPSKAELDAALADHFKKQGKVYNPQGAVTGVPLPQGWSVRTN